LPERKRDIARLATSLAPEQKAAALGIDDPRKRTVESTLAELARDPNALA